MKRRIEKLDLLNQSFDLLNKHVQPKKFDFFKSVNQNLHNPYKIEKRKIIQELQLGFINEYDNENDDDQ